MSDTYEPPKVWRSKTQSGILPISTGRRPCQQEKSCRLANTRCSFTPRDTKWRESHHHAGGVAGAGTQCWHDAWLINIGDGSQFGSSFVAANPNSKIRALDHSEETHAGV